MNKNHDKKVPDDGTSRKDADINATPQTVTSHTAPPQTATSHTAPPQTATSHTAPPQTATSHTAPPQKGAPNTGSSAPGVIVLALAATILFVAALIGLWNSGMLPAPSFLDAFFGRTEETDDGGMAQFIASLEANPPLDTLDAQRVEIGADALASLLGASFGTPGTAVYEINLSSPEGGGLLRTRATVTTTADDPEYWLVELERWNGTAYERLRRVVCSDGVVTVTENAVAADGYIKAQKAEYPASPTFTAEKEAGLPPVSEIIALLSSAADGASANNADADASATDAAANGSDVDATADGASANYADADASAANVDANASAQVTEQSGSDGAPQLELSLVRGTSTAADSRNIAAIRAIYPDGLVDYYEIDVESAQLIRAISYFDGVPYYSVVLQK